MKKFSFIIIALTALILCFAFSACGAKYRSSYVTTLMVRTNTATDASLSFGTFRGTYVIKLKNKSGEQVRINYEASLTSGNVDVYYDYGEGKMNLFELEENSSLMTNTDFFSSKKTIYIIIVSKEKSGEGKFSFSLEKLV